MNGYAMTGRRRAPLRVTAKLVGSAGRFFRSGAGAPLRQNGLHDLAGDVCEAEVASLEAVGEPRMVQARKM